MFRLAVITCLVAVALGKILPEAGRIVGGQATTIEKRPYQVSFKYSVHVCGGSIIDPTHILTAAHCTYGRDNGNMLILAGVTDNTDTKNGQIAYVKNVIEHEKYSDETYENDIAILRLDRALKLDNIKTKAISLIKPGDNSTVAPGKFATVSGWGLLNENGDPTNMLREVNVELISRQQCEKQLAESVPTNMLCAFTQGKDSCQGDSGGPLVSEGKQIGVVSWGYGCARNPGIYTNLIEMYDWIQKNLK